MSRVPPLKSDTDADLWYCDMQDLQAGLAEELARILLTSATANDALPRVQAVLSDCNLSDPGSDQLIVRAEGDRLIFENDASGDYRALVRGSDGAWWLDNEARPEEETTEGATATVLSLIWWGNLEDCAQMAAIAKGARQV